ncbi:glycosyl transferase, group 1 [Candidatus Moduliflexus flocculans]|uniref:Glycosyl transferase, group 1 n=1 Tax=Candidatus Moduliflexus flocculans TaxID=1499966 RepID=A0A081BNE8_9BACT|nr:glycosyl transferase, group 1 [Candidatus Moduliflexus flocculans]
MKKKIKIVYLLGSFDIGGTETQILETLRRLDRDRFELRVAGFGKDGVLRRQLESLGIFVTMFEFFGLNTKTRISSYWHLAKFLTSLIFYIRREQPDIVQTFLFWANIYGSIAAKLARVPVIITGRRGLSERDILRPYYRWLLALSNRWATLILSNSEAAKQHSLLHESGITADKIFVLRNGIDYRRYQVTVDRQNKRQELNISPDAPVIGIVSNLRPYKGLQDAIEAAMYVYRSFPDVVWLFIGRDDGLQADFAGLADRLGVGHVVRFLGQRNDVPELLATLDILVSSSHSEGLPNAVLEGMAAGKAIVATRAGGTIELIDNERSGLLIPERDPIAIAQAVERLLRDQRLREQFGQYARQEAESRFSIGRLISQTETLYNEVCGKGTSHRLQPFL